MACSPRLVSILSSPPANCIGWNALDIELRAIPSPLPASHHKSLAPNSLQLRGVVDCGLQIDRHIVAVVLGVDVALALAACELESPPRAISCTTRRGASQSSGRASRVVRLAETAAHRRRAVSGVQGEVKGIDEAGATIGPQEGVLGDG